MDSPEEAYQKLVERLDSFFEKVAMKFPKAMKCAAGCDDCCQRDLSLYVYEVDRILEAVGSLDEGSRQQVGERASKALLDPEAPCPLLADGRCVIYPVRPVICRTHGLPLLIREDASLSLCPYNFQQVEHIDGECVLNLEPVNQILAAVNHLGSGCPSGFERKSVSGAIVERFSQGTKE